MPRNAPAAIGGVKIWPCLIMNTLSAVHSATLPGVVQHQRFVRAGEIRLDPRHDVVEIIERLHRRIQRGRAGAPRGAGHDRQAAFVNLLRIKRDRRRDNDDARLLTLHWVQTRDCRRRA